ncbi:MAG TPA: GTP cyclohydrolase I FolE [Candidatus Marinimicrobia bacterium]|jgi:GTP cyclohydrolase I|nr:GTP cyclohydrolase I FolE [Candidatus Neomarinimicrobiota bacterium]HIB13919.1 GTP cyclohydrolase I FolE [Candidatus Neomarinimicrobiota bacterium]HIM53044.1 GTP cyclohydrolase I FolE [Candidatus Neomarinimicrobiota bacterium]HIO40738.1 GTP cyclohydrolase I FolE [Candidatus Neomarinimicrobiota bacterium]|tara:strand:- start:975 stop:1547 length:573 start_codon:yes stop_codon:yes gene_type:complete
MTEKNASKIESLIKELLIEIGEDPKREGLVKTPERVAKAWQFLANGYEEDLESIINDAIFREDYDEMVTVKDIDFFSLCEHHLLPFFGKAHVSYIPNGKIIGLSKIPRIVDMFGRRLQVQERMTHQIAETINDVLSPKGVAVVLEGQHMCMQMRGVEKQNSYATTSSMIGQFRKDSKTRDEFLKIISLRK